MAFMGGMTANLLKETLGASAIRGWAQADEELVVPLIQAYLEEACPDFVPSEHNAKLYFSIAARSSRVAMDTKTGKAVGFVLHIPIEAFETKVPMLYSVGTYVLPEYRNKGIGESLRRGAIRVAKVMGYKMLQGVIYTEDNLRGAEKIGTRVVAKVVVYEIGG